MAECEICGKEIINPTWNKTCSKKCHEKKLLTPETNLNQKK